MIRLKSVLVSILSAGFTLSACGNGSTPPAATGGGSTSSSGSGSAFVASPCIAQSAPSVGTLNISTVAAGLSNPWGMAFLPAPDSRILVTERAGRLRLLLSDGSLSTPITGLPSNIAVAGQGGLLDVVLDPNFATNQLIYLSFAESGTGGSGSAVARARLDVAGLSLSNVSVIYRQTPKVSGNGHFGGRLVFDQSNKLLFTMGDRQFDSDLGDAHPSQNPAQSIGKVVRINTDGSIPSDNPFVGQSSYLPEIWSVGHRNVQGAARHPVTGQLWTAEHGARGGDEVNVPVAGKNYGWPVISYGTNYNFTAIGEGTAKAGMEQPRCYWDPSLAPSGMAFYTASRYPAWQGQVFVGALAGTSLLRMTLNGTSITGHERYHIGKRIRDVRQGPDGYLYLLTDASPGGEVLRVGLSN